MKHLILILIPGTLGTAAFSQPTLDCDGYFVTVPAFMRVNDMLASVDNADRNSWMQVNRVRIRPILNISETGFIALEWETDALYQVGKAGLPELTFTGRHQLVDLSWDPVANDRWHIVHTVDRLYYRQQLGAFDITVGRQRIAWGSGRIWNPTDLFNPLNPTTFSKIEKDGIDAATVKLTLGAFSDVTLVYNPLHQKPGNYAFRVRTNVREVDIAGIGGYFDQRLIVGGDFAANLLDAGIRSEMILSVSRGGPSPTFARMTFGADYQWTAKLYTLIEYHHNGEGTTDPARYAISRLLQGEILNVGPDYLAASASYLVHPLVTASVTATANLRDGSRFAALSGVYAPSGEISVTLGAQVFGGEPWDEYWYYPSAGYLKLELFF